MIGIDNGIIISSRVRLARNIDGVNFPPRTSDGDASKLAKDIYNSVRAVDKFSVFNMSNLDIIKGNSLKEKHLISNGLLENKESGVAIINEEETISIMVNEEDHIREQCILPGDNLQNAYKTINSIDDRISDKVDFAYDRELGYLTKCPTNLGTGMRASVMMFLPAIAQVGEFNNCVRQISQFNMTIRGAYGEGSDAVGHMYQISNQQTLGQSENDILGIVAMGVGLIEDAELQSRQILLERDYDGIKDKILRAYGVLTNAYLLGSDEFMRAIALVKLGIHYNFIRVLNHRELNNLITAMQPANLIISANKELTKRESEIYRAMCVAKELKELTSIRSN